MSVAMILAVDPGNQKCGVAVVADDYSVIEKLITPTPELKTTVGSLIQTYQVAVIVVGDRTNCGKICQVLASLGLPIERVDEDRSSMEGRYRFLKENTRGLTALIPIGLRSPNRPYDDYVAVILAERFLQKNALTQLKQ